MHFNRFEAVGRAAGTAGLAVAGWAIGTSLTDGFDGNTTDAVVTTALIAAGALLGALLTPYLTNRPLVALADYLASLPYPTLASILAGLASGLGLAALLAYPMSQLPGAAGIVVPIVLVFALGFVGVYVFVQRRDELAQILPEPRRGQYGQNGREYQVLLDTSAIIDGRIADVSDAGFIIGTLVIPRFILDELRHIADSSDSLRRNRGRRGLEILNKLRKEGTVPLRILDVDIRDGQEADEKLVSLASSMKAPIATTDYNLNRVAEFQGVKVLNVNELANLLKPVVLPGENMRVRVIQEGKEPGQGVGFLDDGTMVVIEGGRRYINAHVEVQVTRALQTAAGRIIFAQPKDEP
ncbi:MAG: putative conserved protein YacL, contains PIN and TRAM domains [Chloroflexi bacterium]|jgi:uncharacterized protein YacL|nr:MAG: putative conserved protein YacL, contains PIN and TRAM domains [Chloroflexota bacterium]